MRKLRNLLPLAAIVLVAGCGEGGPPKTTTTTTRPVPTSAVAACPQAAHGEGAMGVCVPRRLGLSSIPSTQQPAGITWPDMSNNDPCICGAAIRGHGHVGEIDKTNQGVGFTDSYFVRMVKDAARHKLAIGGYDFDSEYTANEVYKFIDRLHAGGIYKGTPNTFPPTLDVEFGAFSKTGLQHQVNILYREYGRVQIYTGGWYYLPHAGCWIPKHAEIFWLSGYPNASVFCGVSENMFKVHQYTDHGYNGGIFSDMNVWRGNGKQFNAYVHRAKPAPTKAQLQAELWREYKRRVALRGLRLRHGCAPPHKVTPYTRAYKRHACPAWTKHGGEVNKKIKELHKAGIR